MVAGSMGLVRVLVLVLVLVLGCCGVLGVHGQGDSPRGNGLPDKFLTNYPAWLDFKKTYNKVYADPESETRALETFLSNLQYIEQHNALYRDGNVSFHLGINVYADLTHEEFIQRMRLDVLMIPGRRPGNPKEFFVPSYIQLPDTVDWRKEGYVTPIKNQQQCGSCWSFSTTGSLEGQHFKKTGKLVSLSEQQLVDCAGSYGNHGCKGGMMDYAFRYIRDKGIEPESMYPYRAKQYSCSYNSSLVVAKCSGYVDVPRNEMDLKSAVGAVGPVSVAIDASHRSFQLYTGGVYDERACSSFQLDHGVLAVGYGTDPSGGDYWLVKNSWGTSWGESGYIRMSRNKNNQCGIASQASYPVV